MKKLTLPKSATFLLINELYEFNGHLEDTRENMNTPIEQLDMDGWITVVGLQSIGITTPEEVDQFAEKLTQIFKIPTL